MKLNPELKEVKNKNNAYEDLINYSKDSNEHLAACHFIN